MQKILHIAAGILVIDGLKIYDQSQAVFFQLNLQEIHGEKG